MHHAAICRRIFPGPDSEGNSLRQSLAFPEHPSCPITHRPTCPIWRRQASNLLLADVCACFSFSRIVGGFLHHAAIYCRIFPGTDSEGSARFASVMAHQRKGGSRRRDSNPHLSDMLSIAPRRPISTPYVRLSSARRTHSRYRPVGDGVLDVPLHALPIPPRR